jgi:Family of unknown function (DUF5995)
MPASLPPIPTVRTIDEVIAAIQVIIDWSISSESRLGYFAALYKRITVAIRKGITDGTFQDGPGMERFDVTFASRYFAALNDYFHPAQFKGGISRCWHVAFEAALNPNPIIVQQMIAGVNAHIDLDLGIAAEAVAPGKQIHSLHKDFNTVNAVLSSQVSTVVMQIDSLSPALAEIYSVLMGHELDLIADGLVIVRDGAWRFAKLLAATPGFVDPSVIAVHDLKVAELGKVILDPPGLGWIIEKIAAKESRDIAGNIRVLDAMAERPAPMTATAAAKI